mgnify:CR=1 FL=1
MENAAFEKPDGGSDSENSILPNAVSDSDADSNRGVRKPPPPKEKKSHKPTYNEVGTFYSIIA